MLRRGFVILFGSAAILGCGGGSGGPTALQSLVGPAEVESVSFTLVNEARTEHGVDPQLDLEARITEVARRHSEAMRDQDFFGHHGPSGTGLRERLQSAGVRFSRAGENLAKVSSGSDPAAVAHGDLMRSERHRVNILDSGYSAIGVGVAQRGNTYWITQVYIAP